MNRESGFSLIELMIVVVIVGVLLGISVPAYQNYMLTSRRADAQASLIDIAARQERFVAQNNTYTTEISAGTGLGVGITTSREGYYNMTVGACGGGAIATCYLVTATAAGSQANDADCLTITYDSVGVKSGTTNDCW
ncbi:MAG: prepilin-type N-terminal cleavage/methylation domain-containing protein [Gammaproteobacteria bacterium]|nr:prepilin-type N-terminal cleavage/methylation domain-containing protein [Gammaproteobacteria bacterium]